MASKMFNNGQSNLLTYFKFYGRDLEFNDYRKDAVLVALSRISLP